MKRWFWTLPGHCPSLCCSSQTHWSQLATEPSEGRGPKGLRKMGQSSKSRGNFPVFLSGGFSWSIVTIDHYSLLMSIVFFGPFHYLKNAGDRWSTSTLTSEPPLPGRQAFHQLVLEVLKEKKQGGIRFIVHRWGPPLTPLMWGKAVAESSVKTQFLVHFQKVMVILEEKIDPPKEALGKEKNFSMVFFLSFMFHVSFPL